MFRVNYKNTRTTLTVNWTYFLPSSSVSLVDFEQVNVGWEIMWWTLKILMRYNVSFYYVLNIILIIKFSTFYRIRTEWVEILRISPYSVRMRRNNDQKNSQYGHILRSLRCLTGFWIRLWLWQNMTYFNKVSSQVEYQHATFVHKGVWQDTFKNINQSWYFNINIFAKMSL